LEKRTIAQYRKRRKIKEEMEDSSDRLWRKEWRKGIY
jgi:hypothetical protein